MRPIIPRISLRSASPIAIVAVLALAPACRRSPELPPATSPQPTATAAAAARVVVLGDSIAAGLGLPEEDAFPAVVQELLRAAGHHVEVVNAGVSGDTSAGGLTRLDWVLRQHPDVVVIELGGNDALRGQPIPGIERNLREIIRRCRAASARVLLLGMDIPTSYGPDYGGQFAAMYERLARAEEVPLVPGFVRELAGDPALLQPDALHPTTEGQRRLAAKLVPHVRALLEEPSASRRVARRAARNERRERAC